MKRLDWIVIPLLLIPIIAGIGIGMYQDNSFNNVLVFIQAVKELFNG